MRTSILIIAAIFLWHSSSAQTKTLEIGKDKTISLIFPYAIKHVDRGAKEILVQRVEEADNVLLVKAASEKIPETNLSVLTDDGNVYSFLIHYNERPDTLVYNLPVNKQKAIAAYATGILDNPPTVYRLHDKRNGVNAQITGIYIKDNIAFYQIAITNSSNINFDIELIRFFIKDKKKMKRTAVQETELKPLHISGNHQKVKAKSRNVIGVALEKFTIPDAKYLAVQLIEKNGGRHLIMKVNNREIMRSIVLPDLR